MVDDDDWNEVRQVLGADISFDDPEAEQLYEELAEYVARVDVLESHGESVDTEAFDAESLKELAYSRYESFVDVVQMKKSAEEYGLEVYDDE